MKKVSAHKILIQKYKKIENYEEALFHAGLLKGYFESTGNFREISDLNKIIRQLDNKIS
ncbi:MAG: hypothetical protein HWN67_16875 [Candidatus Helarchaeota archaeon]|nr:hypothetical protein [Candidatus Helarchaeota archaeon]